MAQLSKLPHTKCDKICSGQDSFFRSNISPRSSKLLFSEGSDQKSLLEKCFALQLYFQSGYNVKTCCGVRSQSDNLVPLCKFEISFL